MTLRSCKVDASPACVEDETSVEDRPIADTVLESERGRLDHHPRTEDFIRQGICRGGEHLWLLTVTCDMLMVFIACLFTAFIMPLFGRNTALPLMGPSTFVPFVLGTMLVVFLVFLSGGLYSSRLFESYASEALSAIGSIVLVAIIGGAIFFAFHLDNLSRMFLLFCFALTLVLVLIERRIWRAIMQACFKCGIGLHKLLLVGSGLTAQSFYEEMVESGKAATYGLDYAGYVALTPNERMGGYLGGAEAYRDILSQGEVKDVFATSAWEEYDIMGRIVATASRFGARFSVVSTMDDLFRQHVGSGHIGHFCVCTLHSSPRTNPSWRFVKRSVDIVGSLAALVLGSPFMLYAAIVIKKNSPDGPIIFKQQRCGIQGMPFTMYKFRTMVTNAEELKEGLSEQNEAKGPVFKISDDPRIFHGAKFLRSSSIDELPQLVNVLKGSMSLVGPRPPLPDEVEKYEDWEWARLSVKPGLTCYWQIGGRSDVGFDEWMRLDLKYVHDQCFVTDVRILLRTFGVVFMSRGAY